jgi:hypothetical protein
MTELQIEYPPNIDDNALQTWLEKLTEFLRKYLSQPFDRGDPADWDFEVGDLTTDAAWNDLDLSGIVDEDAIAVILRVIVQDADGVESAIAFRKNGNSNVHSSLRVRTQVAGVRNDAQLIVFCDTDRKIEYNASDVTWTAINIAVVGWYK